MGEQLLRELERCDPRWRIALPALLQPGAARTRAALIGEHPRGTPNNLMPYVAQVAVGTRAAPAACSATTTTRPTAPACATTST